MTRNEYKEQQLTKASRLLKEVRNELPLNEFEDMRKGLDGILEMIDKQLNAL